MTKPLTNEEIEKLRNLFSDQKPKTVTQPTKNHVDDKKIDEIHAIIDKWQ